MNNTLDKLIKHYGEEKGLNVEKHFSTAYDNKHFASAQQFDFTSQIFYEVDKNKVFDRYVSRHYPATRYQK